MKTLNQIGQVFRRNLLAVQSANKTRLGQETDKEKIHIVGAGGTLTLAYEQLRNAAENAEEHLLLQRAIRRFYKRQFLTPSPAAAGKSGDDLLIELTQAGYVANDSVTAETVAEINVLAKNFATAREKLSKKTGGKTLDHYTTDVLAVEIENLLNDHSQRDVAADFIYQYFAANLDALAIFEGVAPADFDAALFVAIFQTLLRADPAMTRRELLRRYQIGPTDVSFAKMNAQLDDLFSSTTTEKLVHIVDRRGAPFRVLLKQMTDQPDFAEELAAPTKFDVAYNAEIDKTYAALRKSINRGILRSVIFLIITKFLVGIAIEVPYDLLVHHSIAWLPLAVNLAFPPLYMILLRATLIMPGAANTHALASEMDQILYGTAPAKMVARTKTRTFGAGYNIVYTLVILLVFGGVGYGLWLLGFEWIHLVIFFVFISAASFLGFRLARLIREIEVVDGTQSAITLIRDFLYMPFVVVGRGISNAYAQINLVSFLLDMLVELPLKTILRLVRQWGAFMSEKQDSIR